MRIKNFLKSGECMSLLIMFFLLCAFFYLVPYTDDDLRWGSQIGLDRLNNGFAGYGGRYFGYLIVMGLTRSVIMKVLFMSVAIILIAYMVRYITNLSIAPYVVILSVMVAPLSLFSSTIGWVSGFANYVTSICFTLVYISYITYFERNETKRHSIGVTVPLCLLGVINTLIVEHFTIYNLLLGICVVILLALKHKCVFVQFASYAIGSIAGTLWMFSNSAYHNVLAGNDSYRNVGTAGIVETIKYGLEKICKYSYLDNIILNCVIFAALCFVVLRNKECIDKSRQFRVKGCLFINFACIIASIFITKILDGTNSVSTKVTCLIIAISLLGISSLILIALFLADFYGCFKKILFFLISIVILNVPFLIANPVTPRIFFGTYILFTIILCVLLELLFQDTKQSLKTDITRLCKTGLFVGTVFYFAIFISIYKADNERLKAIKQQVDNGVQSVVMYPISHEQFVHDITVYEKWELDGYKQFYHLPENLVLTAERR